MNGYLTFFKRVLLGAGVLLPLNSLIVEFKTNACAAEFFDPIPTWMHIGIVLLMPASIFVPLVARRFPRTLWQPAGDFMHASGLWVSFLYVIALGPMSLMGLFMLPITFFLSLVASEKRDVLACILPVLALLGPLAALAAWNVIFVCILRKLRKRRHALPWLGGLAFGLVAIIAAEWPMIGFKADVREALQLMQEQKGDPGAALSRLRTPTREAVLRRMCYFVDRPKCFGPLMFLFQQVEVSDHHAEDLRMEDLHMLYLRVTGTSFNDVLPPRGFGRKGTMSVERSPNEPGSLTIP